jgi:predicted RNase H-like nuclease (RuvC/YqgF family)
MKDQYNNDNTTAPKIIPNQKDKHSKDLSKQVQELKEKIKEQDQLINRMHRDIVRLRESINQVSARIK